MHDQHHSDAPRTDAPRTIERRCDVAIIGGSAAGLAAALQLGRLRRSVIVVDDGEPRNAPAAHMHSYLGHEGIAPDRLRSIGQEEVRSYGVEVLDGRVVDVTELAARAVESAPDGARFRLELTGGHAVVARRVLVATGLVDELPDVEGLASRWGRDVVHCPFCHGYELRDRPIVQLVTHPMGLHPAALFSQLTDSLTVVLHDDANDGSTNHGGIDDGRGRIADLPDDDPALAALVGAGVEVLRAPARRVLTSEDETACGVELADGTTLAADAVAVTTRFAVRLDAVASLGLTASEHPSGLGAVLDVAPDGETSVPGVHAAGNVTDPSQQVLHAAAHGSRVAAMIGSALAHEDLAAAGAPSAHQLDWDHRYGGEQLWSGNPNGSLVAEAEALEPGRALDVGAGEGGDAIWLAEQGWAVTAVDVSERALERVGAEADRRGLQVTCRRVDANDRDPFEGATFDLVSAHYASIPRTPDGRGVANLLDAVAPGGTLLVVGHDLAPMRGPIDTSIHSRAFDPDAFVRVDDVAAAMAESPDWAVQTHESRPRPPGAASTHHVDDVVLRARRSERTR